MCVRLAQEIRQSVIRQDRIDRDVRAARQGDSIDCDKLLDAVSDTDTDGHRWTDTGLDQSSSEPASATGQFIESELRRRGHDREIITRHGKPVLDEFWPRRVLGLADPTGFDIEDS